nr:hypothetical protein CFP56_24549 [Quercus suber]
MRIGIALNTFFQAGGAASALLFRLKRIDGHCQTMHRLMRRWEWGRRTGEPRAQALIQRADLLDLVGGEVEAADVEVLLQAALVIGLGDDGDAALRGPAQQHLGRRLAVLGRDALDGRVLEQQGGVVGLLHVELEERLRAEGRVGGDGDVAALAQVEQVLLDEVGVVLDLERLWQDLGVSLDVEEEGAGVVADADGADQTFVVQGLHSMVGLFERGLAELDLVVLVEEAGRVADRGVDVLEGDGEVDDEEVEIVDAPVGELFLGDGLDAFLVVEAVPELGDDEEVLTLDEAFVDGALDALAGLDLVAVIAGAVEETVAGLDGVVDGVGAGVVGHLPQPEADERHLLAIVQLGGGSGGHVGVCANAKWWWWWLSGRKNDQGARNGSGKAFGGTDLERRRGGGGKSGCWSGKTIVSGGANVGRERPQQGRHDDDEACRPSRLARGGGVLGEGPGLSGLGDDGGALMGHDTADLSSAFRCDVVVRSSIILSFGPGQLQPLGRDLHQHRQHHYLDILLVRLLLDGGARDGSGVGGGLSENPPAVDLPSSGSCLDSLLVGIRQSTRPRMPGAWARSGV